VETVTDAGFFQVYCPHIGALELIYEPQDGESEKLQFRTESVNLDDCTLFPGSKVRSEISFEHNA
jgi:hypothetical protein